MNALITAATLIIHVLFDGYIIILLLRLLLQKLGASWHNPISQFLIKITGLPLRPLQKFIPGFHGFDLSIVVFTIILQFIEITVLCLLQFGTVPHVLGVLVMSLGELLSKCVYIYMYAIIINAISTWIVQLQSHPIAHVVYVISEPLLSLFRRLIPLISGIDISPIFALLGLTMVNILIVAPLLETGTRIILG